MRRRNFIIISCVLLISQILAAESTDTIGLTNSDKVFKEAVLLNQHDYPNSDSIVVDDLTKEEYKPDGTGKTLSDTSIKIFTEKGKRANRVYSIDYSAEYSKIEIILAEIIKPNGKIVKIDLDKHCKSSIDSSQMSSNIYNPNSKVLTISIPDLQINDTLRIVSNSTNFKTPIPNTWSTLVTFEGTSPIHHQAYTVIAPHSLPLKKIAILDKVGKTLSYSKTEEMTGIVYKWEASNVPLMFPEPQMPSLSSVVQRIVISTIPNWEYVSKWYWNLCKPHLKPTPEMKTKVQELIKNTKTDQDKIKAIFDFVSQKIRYMGLIAEQNSPGFEPHDVKLTFDNRYGVCRDKAALLTEMLRLAGFKAYPVIIKVGTKLDKEVPLIWFNHAITCVELNSKNILMDPTNEATKDIFPAYLSNCSYIVAKPVGATLKTSDVIPANSNMMNIHTEGELSKNGILNSITAIECLGINDTVFRNALSRLTPSQIRELFDEIMRRAFPSSKITKLDIFPKDLMNTAKNVKIVISYTTDNDLIKGKNNAMLSVQWLGNLFGFVGRINHLTGLNKRKYPLVTSFTCGYNESINIKINDPDLKLEYSPKFSTITSDILDYNQTIKIDNGTLSGKSHMTINDVEFSPKQYLQLKDYLKKLEVDRKKKVIFSVKPKKEMKEKADSVILNKNVNITLNDNKSWTETSEISRKILTYNGKKNFAEIRIPYNPAVEDVKLISAEVIDKENSAVKITRNEINIMDAGWNSSAPRYPGGKILVANLPKVEIGSIIKYKIQREIKSRPFFSDILSFQSFSPINKVAYTVTYPNNIILKTYKAFTDNIHETISSSNNEKTITWTAENIDALSKEGSLPPSWTFKPSIIISTGDYQSYIKELHTRLIKTAENQPNTQETARNLTKGIKDNSGKIKAIRDFVAKNIRTAGPNFTSLPSYSISQPDTTLKDKYGNKADQAVLLYSMLKYTDLKPKFTAVSDMPFIQNIFKPLKNTPLYSFLDNILIRVKQNNGISLYLNDTDEYSELGTTAHQGCIGYNQSENKFFKIEAEQNKNDDFKIYYDLKLENNGEAELKVTKKYFGNLYSNTKEMFDKMRPEDRSRYYQKRIINISQSAIPTSDLFTNFNSYPGIEKYSAKISNYAILENDFFYFSLPLRLSFILNLDADKRLSPFFASNTESIKFYISVTLPDNYRNILIHPVSSSWYLPNDSGNITISTIKNQNNKYQENISVKIDPDIYSPEAYQNLLRISKQVSSLEITSFLLEK